MKKYIRAAVKDILDESWSVQYHLADNPATNPQILARLAQSEADDIRIAVSHNPSTPEETLLKLAKDPSFSVKARITDRRSIPDSVLLTLLDDEDTRILRWVLSALMPDDDNPPRVIPSTDVYMKLATHEDREIRCDIARSAAYIDLPLEVQKILARDEDRLVRRDVVLYRENIPAEIVDMLKDDPDSSVRYAIARDVDGPREYYEHFAKDPDEGVRKAVIFNPKTPLDIIEQLTYDHDEEIRKRAEDKLYLREHAKSRGFDS